jgi:hypothetical protein
MKEDLRKYNGGNSTKAKGDIDLRKNPYKNALRDASTPEDVIQVVRMLKEKALKKNDVRAAELFLKYYLGLPKESIDITSGGEAIAIPIIQFKKSGE